MLDVDSDDLQVDDGSHCPADDDDDDEPEVTSFVGTSPNSRLRKMSSRPVDCRGCCQQSTDDDRRSFIALGVQLELRKRK